MKILMNPKIRKEIRDFILGLLKAAALCETKGALSHLAYSWDYGLGAESLHDLCVQAGIGYVQAP